MADLDNDLSRRLSRLAAAVPTSRTALDPVHRGAVEARQRVRMAWVTPLVALVAILVGTTLAGTLTQPDATLGPGGHASPTERPSPTGQAQNPNHIVSSTTRSGDFELHFESAKAWYLPDEPIQMTASLTYVGPERSIRITHGFGGPMSFGIVEAVDGLTLSPAWRLSCNASELTRDVPLNMEFFKRGGFDGADPRASEFDAFFADPTLELPVGTWHPYVVASFSMGDCAGDDAGIRAEIEIEVVESPPEGTNGADGAGPANIVHDGPFALQLRAGKTRYSPDEAIDVMGTLAFAGPEDSVEFRHDSSGPIMFGIREKVFGEIDVGSISLLTWDTTILQRSIPYVRAFQKGGGMLGDHPDVEMHMRWMEDPELRLPEGTWHLYAIAQGSRPGDQGEAGWFALSAEIEIVVDDDPAATPGHAPATEYPFKPVYGGADIGGMALQLKSERPVYEVGAPIELSVWYWFMDGPDVIASHFQPEVALSIEQLDSKDPQGREVFIDSVCTDLGLVTGEERHVEIGPRLITRFQADEVPASLDDLFVDGELHLPVGRWRISALVIGEFGPCSGGGEPYEISTSLEIDVVEGLS